MVRNRWTSGVAAAMLAALSPALLGAEAAGVVTEITDEGPRIGTQGAIAYYPVNRLLDLLDIVSVQVGFGFGVHANAHATRAVQAGFGGSAVAPA